MSPSLLRYILVLGAFLLLGFIFFRKKQIAKRNWATFYATLWVATSLSIVNYLCVHYQFWHFTDAELWLGMPYDLYFVWVLIWGVLPAYFLQGRYIPLVALALFWLDLLWMPELDKLGILVLTDNWLWGEIALILFVFLPAYTWANGSYFNRHLPLRAFLQVLVMSQLFLILLPILLFSYLPNHHFQLHYAPFLWQFLFIIVFPAFVAVQDLVTKGKGTPFPYDPTQELVQTGVYAYCRNPIQWSFTLLFIPLSMCYECAYLLLGSVVSIAYTIGVSDPQEYPDMEERFGQEWTTYIQQVPPWYFLWKPKNIPKGTIYFDYGCNSCSQLKEWFAQQSSCNLDIKNAADYTSTPLSQVTYVDHRGHTYQSVRAIACAFEHINLAWASLAWFMRMPLIADLLQLIVNSMGLWQAVDRCDNS